MRQGAGGRGRLGRGGRAAASQEQSRQEGGGGPRGPAAFVWGVTAETQLYTLFYGRPGIGPGGARASCTIARRRASWQPRVGELQGASGGRRGKRRKAKARNPGRPSEKSENVLGARGKQRRARSRAHILSLSPTFTHALTPTPHRLPTHAVLASAGSRASAPKPGRERSRPPTPPTPRLSRALPPGHGCPENDWGSWEGPQGCGSGKILPAER